MTLTYHVNDNCGTSIGITLTHQLGSISGTSVGLTLSYHVGNIQTNHLFIYFVASVVCIVIAYACQASVNYFVYTSGVYL